jgi:phage terminase large subunit GpA-like protein
MNSPQSQTDAGTLSEWARVTLPAAWKILEPPPRLRVSEWADRFRRLSGEASAEPGPWRTDRAEYQRGLMDAINERGVETVTVMTAAQVGKTEVINNILGYFIHQDPSPILLIQPTLEMGMAWSKDRFGPMVRDTAVLTGRVGDARAKDGTNTILHKTFPGGHLTVAGANSPASLASRPIRVVLFDEVDKYPASAGAEGDPIKLGTKRSQTFWNRKIVMVSTPTIKGVSRVEHSYEHSDRRTYHVPCPKCGAFQPLIWAGIKFGDDRRPPYYECVACKAEIEETEKLRMVNAGRWVKGNPEVLNHAGFHLNELYSPWSSWPAIVDGFRESKPRRETLRVWVNTVLGETWEEEEGYTIPEENLEARVETYEGVPDEVLVLAAGVDVQDDRVEIVVRGYGKGYESWFIERRTIYGSPERTKTWAEVQDVLTGKFRRDDGTEILIDAVGVDSGFRTQQVYKFVKDNHARRYFALKGYGGAGRPFIGAVKYGNKAGARLVALGVDEGKRIIYDRLEIDVAGPGFYHFSQNCDRDYFAQLTAEKQVTKFARGFPTKVWVKKDGRRNEVLDCEVYNYAAVLLINPNFEKIAERRAAVRPAKKEAVDPSGKPAVRSTIRRGRSKFMDNWKI